MNFLRPSILEIEACRRQADGRMNRKRKFWGSHAEQVRIFNPTSKNTLRLYVPWGRSELAPEVLVRGCRWPGTLLGTRQSCYHEATDRRRPQTILTPHQTDSHLLVGIQCVIHGRSQEFAKGAKETVWGRKSPIGIRGRALGGGLGRSAQKPETYWIFDWT